MKNYCGRIGDNEYKSAFQNLLQDLEDQELFKDNPDTLALLDRRRDREIRALSDTEGRRRERLKREAESQVVYSPDRTVEDQMKDILERFEKPSKK